MKSQILTTLSVLLVLTLASCASTARAVDLAQIEKDLTSDGVVGWIHGGVPQQGIFVFTYRNPSDFFDYVEMSLVSDDDAIMKKLASFTRHDKVRVKGKFLKNPSPQKHIKIASIELVQAYSNPYPSQAHSYESKLPDDLQGKTSSLFLVHAVGGDGHILVVEYKDSVVPVYVKNGDLTKNLFRGDLVELQFKISDEPDSPMHLRLNEKAPQPVKVVESIQALHGKTGTIEGALILFPKSPEIMFNVFAVQQLLPGGLSRQFTLVNFDSPEVFQQIRGALQKAWDHHPNAFTNGRNKLVSNAIRVKATGTFNEVSENQANPQILLNSVESIQIIEN